MKQLVAQVIVALVVKQGALIIAAVFLYVNSANMSFWTPRKLSWIRPHALL